MENNKKQLIERLKSANNVLVTVSANPSVDQLAAAIGLTLMLNKLGKHGTAVFSGQTPSTIEFLQPEKTLEKNTDSLRDFIIALDKSKADKLRYKVEGDHVRIFITPYRTSISEADLDFSQGDFNVDVVVALGVNDQKDLDQAIVSHGRILHDATTISVTTGEPSKLGSINWADDHASSLCEMVASLADSLQQNLLDAQMATALMTGIVAQTDRFSNEKTLPSTMSISAALMAAGANQQLVASKLEEPAPPPPEPETAPPVDGDTSLSNDGSLTISHNAGILPEDFEDHGDPINKIHIDDHGNVKSLDDENQEPSAPAEQSQVEPESELPPLPEPEPLPEISGVKAGGSFLPDDTPNSELSVGNVPAGYSDPSDTINAPQPDIPLLNRDDDENSNEEPEKPDETLQTPEPQAEPPAPQPEPVIPPAPTFEPPAAEPAPQPEPPAPEQEGPIVEELAPEDKDQTLSELEAAVQASYESNTAEQPQAVQSDAQNIPMPGVPTPTDGLDNARDAVSDALASINSKPFVPTDPQYDQPVDLPEVPPAPELPGNDTQAFTMPENLVPPTGLPDDPTAAPVTDPTAPPAVPPPFMPDMNGFDPGSMPPAPQPPTQPPGQGDPSNPFNLPPS